MLLILQKLESKHSYEIRWIYCRPDGYYLLLENNKDLKIGDQVSIAKYSPKLDKKTNTSISKIEINPINSNIYVVVKDKRYMPYFKQALIEKENKR